MEELKEEYKEYEDLMASGTVVDAINLFTQQEVKVIITTTEVKDEVNAASGNAGHDATKAEIVKIEDREKRSKELDAEKIWEQIRGLLAVKENQQTIYVYEALTVFEVKAFCIAIFQSFGYHTRQMACKILGIDNVMTYKFDLNDINALARILVFDKLVNAFGSHISSDHNAIAYDVIKRFLPKEITKIELDQQGITEARVERVGKKIKALKEKLIHN